MFEVLGALMCCWEMWQPSLHSLLKIDVSSQRAITVPVAGWCRSEPELTSLLEKVHIKRAELCYIYHGVTELEVVQGKGRASCTFTVCI